MEKTFGTFSKVKEKNYRTYSMDLCGRKLSVDIGRMSAQANGACYMHYGDTTLLATATASKAPREGIDFFPLSVEYEEKYYAVGKIPGGYNKREGKASEHAILTGRVIDRPMRPLFPKDYRNDVLLDDMVMSVDPECPPEVLAMLGSSLATSISDIPFDGPCAATQVGLIDGEFVFNPGYDQQRVSDLQLTVASTRDKVIMIEAGANEVSDEVMIDAIYKAHEINKTIIAWMDDIVAKEGKPKHAYESCAIPQELFDAIKEIVPPADMEEACFTDDKQTREKAIDVITAACAEAFKDREDWLAILGEAIYQYEKKTIRKMILKDHKRPDGRQQSEIRPLAAEVDTVARVHGSAMFTRGQTQIINVTALGPLSEMQKLDGMDVKNTEKRYMHHYNFPAYSVGETKASRGPGRREIGHGALAERALLPVLPSKEEFPYAIRTVSETAESNGSTSQASVCASSLSLMAAGVPIKSAVAGISCGLVTGDTDDEYLVLTDIQGLEDFFGDMDFKVAGTHKGITAIQMDIKIHGLTRPIVEEAIARAHEARVYIMDEIMAKAIVEPRKELSPYAPKIQTITIDPSKIGDVVGKQGKTINGIIEKTGVTIDITDDGIVSICGLDPEMMQMAADIIQSIVDECYVGEVIEGTVVNILSFGAQVELAPNKKGLVHISRLAEGRVNKVEDVVKVGDQVTVKVIRVDTRDGKIDLSMKPSDINSDRTDWSEEFEDRRPRRDDRRGGRGDRDRKPFREKKSED